MSSAGPSKKSRKYRVEAVLNGAERQVELKVLNIETGEVCGTLVARHGGGNIIEWEMETWGTPAMFETEIHLGRAKSRMRQFWDLFEPAPEDVDIRMRIPEQWTRSEYKVVTYRIKTGVRIPDEYIAKQIVDMCRTLRKDEEAAVDPTVLALSCRFLGTPAMRQRLWGQKRQPYFQNDSQALAAKKAAEIREQERKKKAARARRAQQEKTLAQLSTPATPPVAPPPPAPPIEPPIHIAPGVWGKLPENGTTPVVKDLSEISLLERAALLWISNQTDDLLALPYCRIERLEYQVRTALRVIGAMRGRALLSDEVGLGKTIEAGLILKEYLTRGMARRFLVLTTPSLIDQWQEELESKFGIETATTNASGWRSDPAGFWNGNSGIIASLHTVRQPAHLELARQVPWDLLIVDEAHYLRNRTSKGWQAVNELPRQFLLLLTATPVQNSLEELYNLVTLLQPGQLPPPKEFAQRFIDRKRPRQPREPEELRRLLNRVMIRNTRANAGIDLPSRRAETVLFEPEPAEKEFFDSWEKALRETLPTLPGPQAAMSGRTLLQTAGSSPAAWEAAMQSFPDKKFAKKWLAQPAPRATFDRKVAALPPLSATEGGLVVFTQFIATQEALAEKLKKAGVKVWLINGQTPAPERQPITEHFRKEGGILLLTRSGTEGRNLQFSHRLVNFDLPWNPMEIEQRIGRLHRLGQKRVVQIYNLVSSGTLQAHLLELLQEKLNLFELVVGETGLILGEQFSSDDFSEEVFRCWREAAEGDVEGAFKQLGDAVASARAGYEEVRQLDSTLFSHDYETL